MHSLDRSMLKSTKALFLKFLRQERRIVISTILHSHKMHPKMHYKSSPMGVINTRPERQIAIAASPRESKRKWVCSALTCT